MGYLARNNLLDFAILYIAESPREGQLGKGNSRKKKKGVLRGSSPIGEELILAASINLAGQVGHLL